MFRLFTMKLLWVPLVTLIHATMYASIYYISAVSNIYWLTNEKCLIKSDSGHTRRHFSTSRHEIEHERARNIDEFA